MRIINVLAVALVLCTTAAWTAEYKIDPAHSSTIFKVKHLGASYVYGQFVDTQGTVIFDAAKPEASSVNVTIKTASITTHNQARDRHLSGPDFFNVKEFPVMTFKSRSWKKSGKNTYTVMGDLTMVGVKKSVTVEVEAVGVGKNARSGKELRGFHTVFKIDRTDFGMGYGVAPDGNGLGKDIEVTISVESIRQ